MSEKGRLIFVVGAVPGVGLAPFRLKSGEVGPLLVLDLTACNRFSFENIYSEASQVILPPFAVTFFVGVSLASFFPGPDLFLNCELK